MSNFATKSKIFVMKIAIRTLFSSPENTFNRILKLIYLQSRIELFLDFFTS